MNKEFIPYEESLALKELEFDEPCILLFRGLDTQPVCQMGYEFKTARNSEYGGEINYWITVPTFSQAFRWFRDNYGLNHEIPYGLPWNRRRYHEGGFRQYGRIFFFNEVGWKLKRKY